MTSLRYDTVDWAATLLPPQSQWPAGLASTLQFVLAAPVPAAVVVGDDAVLVYNDAYARILGRKHPSAFGQRAPVALAENWALPGHGEIVEQVYRSGEPFYEADTVLPVFRRGPDGPRELVHFTRAYTPVRDDDGSVVAVLSLVTETTEVNRALSGMATLGARLAAAVSVDAVAREALSYAVSDLGAEHARLMLADGRGLRLARRTRVDEDDETVARLPPVWLRVDPATRLPTVEVTRTGHPLWLGPEDLAGYSGLEREPVSVRALTRVATVPVRSGGIRGALAIAWESLAGFTATERDAFTAVGHLVAQALARATRFDEQLEVADTLQLSMLPGALPQLPGFSLAARYAPSGQGAAAGGDFYDAFELPDGRLALVIGDVVGHGVRAATVMGQVRAAVRVLTVREGEPVAVLGGLDDFVASVGEECFVTMLLALVDPVSRTVQLACAGHLPPLLCRNVPGSAESAPVAVTPGAPVGLGGERTAMEFALDVDDVLVLYTDGLVEVPGEDLEAAIEALAADVSGAAASGDPRRIGSDLVDKRRTHDDDAAVLVLVVSERRHRVASVELPPEARSAAAARSWARGVLEAWSANEDVVDSALLGISELVSNSVLHAQSTVRVELDLDDRCLLVLVTDAGGHSSPSPQDVEPTSSRGRGLAVVRAIATAWGNEQSSRGSTVWFELARSG